MPDHLWGLEDAARHLGAASAHTTEEAVTAHGALPELVGRKPLGAKDIIISFNATAPSASTRSLTPRDHRSFHSRRVDRGVKLSRRQRPLPLSGLTAGATARSARARYTLRRRTRQDVPPAASAGVSAHPVFLNIIWSSPSSSQLSRVLAPTPSEVRLQLLRHPLFVARLPVRLPRPSASAQRHSSPASASPLRFSSPSRPAGPSSPPTAARSCSRRRTSPYVPRTLGGRA